MRLEQIIASSCRQKMLLGLAKVKKTHVTQLVRMINSTYNQVNRNLEILEEEGIIKTQRLGYLKIVELQRENPKTLKLLKALELLDTHYYCSKVTRA
jgi:DNA-binding transcriptional ArsR family regulator